MIKLIKYSFLMIGLFAYSQENTKNNEEKVKVTKSSKIKNIILVTSNPTIKIKKLYPDIKQAKNRTPKELLNSLTSENSVEWSIDANGHLEGNILKFNCEANPLAFNIEVKATLSGVNLVNYKRKIGTSTPIIICKDFPININL